MSINKQITWQVVIFLIVVLYAQIGPLEKTMNNGVRSSFLTVLGSPIKGPVKRKNSSGDVMDPMDLIREGKIQRCFQLSVLLKDSKGLAF